MVDIFFIGVALVVTVLLAAVVFGTDSRDGYIDDHQRASTGG